MVVFDGIPRHRHVHPLQPLHGAQHGELHVGREGCADAVRIDQVRVEPLRLEEDLMTVAIRETVDLVLDRGAISWALRVDRPGEHRRAM